jgi:signal recognition particle GTPase
MIYHKEVSAEEVDDALEELSGLGYTVSVYPTQDRFLIQWAKTKRYLSYTGDEHDDEAWLTEAGEMIFVQDLTEDHARNIVRMFIHQRREQIQQIEKMYEAMESAMHEFMQQQDEENEVAEADVSPNRNLH